MLTCAALAGACYEPEVLDCTLLCSAGRGCADGQVCDRDGWCTAPEVAGTCGAGAVLVPVRLTIERRGNLRIDELDQGCECDDDEGTCSCDLELAEGTEIVVQAVRTDNDFERWLTDNCEGQGASCTLTVEMPRTDVGARFRR